MEADDVAPGCQFLQRQVRHTQLFFRLLVPAVPGIVINLSTVGSQPLGGSLANGAKAYQSHLRGGQIQRHVGLKGLHRLILPALQHHAVSPQGTVQQHGHQHDRLLRHGPGIASGVIADIDAPAPRRLQVDAVKSHALAVDHFQVGHPGDQALPHPGHRRDEEDLGIASGG